MKKPLPISSRVETLKIGSPEWRKVCSRINELDTKSWTKLSEEEGVEYGELMKQLPN